MLNLINMEKTKPEICCIYYSDETVEKCLGFTEGIKFPSKKELMEFCLSGNFKNCPVYLKKGEGAVRKDEK